MGKRRQAPEKGDYEACWQLYRTFGCDVYRFAQARASKQTPGIPDLAVYHMETGEFWWHEVKTERGRQSDGQRVFQYRAQTCGQRYVLGGYEAALETLLELGVAEEYEGALRRRKE